ncbi:dopamine beta hydroxylase-like protein precursor [Elysia marginata]|uniref:Dopamine beta hydroxylase-like protein n=1 Tax=Elysia marginata TaxID=1093978 RepID=A0AAV4EXD7_9GAST|nr:dopamine beta hydroxylase-like protein precursor [Elysia marginata]
MLKVLALTLLVSAVLAYPTYKPLIPNGFSVPNPCQQGIWQGVGHLAHLGAGPLNPFGEAFRNNGFKWDRTLCMMDSDNDGRTNGEELGDAACRWSETNPARLTAASGHPGICEPVGSAKCAGSNFRC